jgi:hypothetical protein
MHIPCHRAPVGFVAQPTNRSLLDFEAQTKKTSRWFLCPNQENVVVILRIKSPNHNYQFWGPNRETRATGFEAKPKETKTTDKPSTLVLRLNQETCATHLHMHGADRTRFSKRDKDKDKTTEMSQIRIQTSPSQWLITIKPRNWSFSFSISPLMSSLTTNGTKFEVRIQDPTKHN